MPARYEHFSAVISSISRSIQKIERDEMERYGCKGAFAQYLAAMTHRPEGVTAAQLCEICDRDKAAVSRAVSEMEEKGLICRGPGGYRARLQLTEEGRRAASFVFDRARLAVEAVGHSLTDDNRQTFYAVLEDIAANLEAVSRDGIPENAKDNEEEPHERTHCD
ncbi:MAG: MarR family transcriptional regulator [Clostridia bacterium]|nr:MarR family transcriptional regulator [Clostridia bacterium]